MHEDFEHPTAPHFFCGFDVELLAGFVDVGKVVKNVLEKHSEKAFNHAHFNLDQASFNKNISRVTNPKKQRGGDEKKIRSTVNRSNMKRENFSYSFQEEIRAIL